MSQQSQSDGSQKPFSMGRGLLASETLNFNMSQHQPGRQMGGMSLGVGMGGMKGPDGSGQMSRLGGGSHISSPMKLFASLGLSPSDLDTLAELPEDQINMETLPRILMQLKNRKGTAGDQGLSSPMSSEGAYRGGRDSWEPALGQGPVRAQSSADFGFSSMQDVSSRSYGSGFSSAASSREQRAFSELSYDRLRMGLPPSDSGFRRMGSPTSGKIQDFLDVIPSMFPHVCSLCDFDVHSVMEWKQHTNSLKHAENKLRLRELYPEWDPGMLSGRRDSRDTPNLSPGLLGAPPMSSRPAGGMSSSWGSGSHDLLDHSQKSTKVTQGKVVVVKYDRRPLSNQTLLAFAEPFGRIAQYLILNNKAFLEMASRGSALDMVAHYKRNPATLYGKRLNFYVSEELMTVQRGERVVEHQRTEHSSYPPRSLDSQVVFFSNLPMSDAKKKELLVVAGRFGVVEQHLFLSDKAFVQLGTPEDAQMMVKYYTQNPLTIDGRAIRLNICTKYKQLNLNHRRDGGERERRRSRSRSPRRSTSRSREDRRRRRRRSSSSKEDEEDRPAAREEQEEEEGVSGVMEGEEEEEDNKRGTDEESEEETEKREEEKEEINKEEEKEGGEDTEEKQKEEEKEMEKEQLQQREEEEEEEEEAAVEKEKEEEKAMDEEKLSQVPDGGDDTAAGGAKQEVESEEKPEEAEGDVSAEKPKEAEQEEKEEGAAEPESCEAAGQEEGAGPAEGGEEDFLENMEDFVTLDELEEDEGDALRDSGGIDNSRRAGMRVVNIMGFRRGLNFLSDILALAKPFGKVVKHLVLDLRPEAYLQFEKEEEAVAMSNFYNGNVTPSVCGRPVRVTHSLSYPTIQSGSSRVVYIGQIPDIKYSDMDVLKLAEPFGRIRRYFLHRLKRECFVEMEEAEHAEKMAETCKEKPLKFGGKRLTIYVSRKYRQLKHGHLYVGSVKREAMGSPPAKRLKADGDDTEQEAGPSGDGKEAGPEKRESEENKAKDEEPTDAAANENGRTEEKPLLPPYDPDAPVGAEFVKMGYYCRLCFLFYSNEDTAKINHCSSRGHYDKLKKHLEKEQKAEKKKKTEG